MNSSVWKVVAGVLGAIVALGLIRFKPWQRSVATPVDGVGREILKVGFLPVTCHLTCPVTDFASRTSSTTRFESERFTDFPTVVETIKAGHLDASFMIVPLAMRLREQGVPVKICYLGHRDGTTIMVRKQLPGKNLADFKGKTFAIPSKYSNQHLMLRRRMEVEGLAPTDIRFVELPPPDMPGALASGAIDGYIVGEPHAARAELDGSGRVLFLAKDIWPGFISCCLVVTEKLLNEKPEVARDLVRGIAESGEWAERHRLDAAKLAAPFFRQDERVIRYVLTQPPDRVSYRQLTPTDKDLQSIQDMGIRLGVLKDPIPMSELIDRRFIPEHIEPARISVPEKVEVQ